MLQDLVNCAFDAVTLKLEQCLPNLGIHDFDVLVEQSAFFLISKEILEDVVKRFEIDEFWRVILVELVEVEQNILLHIGDNGGVVPQFVEPRFQITTIPRAINFQI